MTSSKTSRNYQQAKKRAEAKLGFYIHAAIFLIVNVILIIVDLVTSPDKHWFYWPLLGWGVGLLGHGALVFLKPGQSSLKEAMIKSELEELEKEKNTNKGA